MVTDYRYLNKRMVCNNYLLPLISQLIDKLKGSDMYTKMDLHWGYNNVCIKDGHEWKGVFVMPIRSYESVMMSFGMCNSPNKFQQMMNVIFRNEMHKSFLMIYMYLLNIIHSYSYSESCIVD